jgi:hypothetical protein
MWQEWQEEERRIKEVAVDLQQRIRQELAYPAVVHFYIWLLQGAVQVIYCSFRLVPNIVRLDESPVWVNCQPLNNSAGMC